MGGYQIKVIIKESRPPVWRRLTVPDQIPFSGLHEIIQTVFQKSGHCLFRFEVPAPHRKITGESELIDSYLRGNSSISYTCILKGKTDFKIEVEKILPDYSSRFPAVIKYKGSFLSGLDAGDINRLLQNNLCFSADGTKLSPESRKKKIEDISADCPADSLADVYRQYTKEDLLEIAHIHRLEQCTQMEKSTLASYLSEYVLQPGAMEDFFLTLTDLEIQAFEAALEGYFPIDDEDIFDAFLDGGYCAVDEDNEIYLPPDTAAAYLVMNTEGFRSRREHIWKQIQYCYYCVSIYGAAPLSLIADLYNAYEEHRITQKDLINLYFLPSPHAYSFGYHDRMFVDAMLLEDPNLLEDIISIQKDYAYYHPSREEITLDNSEPDSAALSFTSYLVDELGFQIPEASDLTRRISYIMKVGADPEHIFEMLQKGDVVFADQAQADTFAEKMMDLYVDTRLFIASGHTPAELDQMEHQENS
ncbi:IS1096 element passenger TnpR family protein [Anaerostipes sp.]|uniref:IS1096 element passenger TnpR family protein n=1 Tax=Anaerostipes sp. TaxID=1872530 RepID=UPI0025BA9B0C|nr:hypothetical protein [Anaerostipes sp.]MBS7009826.1 hypothetical protein [Anaerostipes sp.]